MKKIYVLACSALLAGSAFAQVNVSREAANKTTVVRQETTAGNFISNPEREVFYSNDFSNAADWLIQNAGDVGTAGYADLQFEIGVGLEPTGFAPIDALVSTTAENGFAMVDSDLYGGEEGGTEIENCWIQTVNPIDCSGQATVALGFENFYRMWDGGSDDGNEYCLVEVSLDGTTWPDINTYEVSEADPGTRYELWPDMGTQDPVSNPTYKFFDLSSIAAGESTVYLRFRWKGTWGYAWMIDDLEMFDLPDDNLAVTGVTYSDLENTGIYELGVYSLQQPTELVFRADVVNLGANDQTGVDMTVNINGTSVGTGAAEDVLYGESDSLFLYGYAVPDAVGDYDIEYVVNMTNEDFDPSDNGGAQSFSVTEWQMGRDNGVFETFRPNADYADVWRGGPIYDIFVDGVIYALDIALWENSVPGSDITGYIMDSNSPASDGLVPDDIIGQSDELEVAGNLLNTIDDEGAIKWTTLVLQDPVEVFAGDAYLAAVGTFSGAGVSVLGSPNTHDFSNYVFGDFGTAGEDWYWTSTNLLIRLNFNPDATVNVEENIVADNVTLSQNYPNPATDNTRISFEMKAAGTVSLEVYDVTGKLVINRSEGTLPTGTHTIDLNVNDLTAGVYQYSLIVDGTRLTRPMMVK